MWPVILCVPTDISLLKLLNLQSKTIYRSCSLSFRLISLMSHKTPWHQKNVQTAKGSNRRKGEQRQSASRVACAPFLIPSAYTIFAPNRQGLFREQLFNILFFLSYILNLIFNYSNVALKAEMIHFSLDFSVTPFTIKSAPEMLMSTFDMFALSELCGLREGLFGTKYFLALLPHFCSAPACSQLRPCQDLSSLLSFSHPMEGWSQSPFPVVTAQLFPSPPDSTSALFTPPGSGKG